MFAESTRVAFLKFRLRWALRDESRWLAYALFLYLATAGARKPLRRTPVCLDLHSLAPLLHKEHHDHGPAFRLGSLDNGIGHIVAMREHLDSLVHMYDFRPRKRITTFTLFLAIRNRSMCFILNW